LAISLTSIVTDDLDQLESGGHRSLLDHPQPLGILPTRWFWNDRKNWRLVSWAFGILVFVTLVILDVLGLHWLANVAIIVTVLFLAQGLLEKYIRHQALKRRPLVATATDDALPESHD
jgi:hypothetical protein